MRRFNDVGLVQVSSAVLLNGQVWGLLKNINGRPPEMSALSRIFLLKIMQETTTPLSASVEDPSPT
ncbi:hypothetical protein DPMN_161775 [Dreissena polymorpha]|uniref:Uncharacterized protein n=1 Tax=Dreissena polymorpha TaxID=45954 RepID=A0A9D4ETM1_DREPO|nr:hypothetical protein DPMN_161775 [Dreissena polymorpha]